MSELITVRELWRVVDHARAAAAQVTTRITEGNEELVVAVRRIEQALYLLDQELGRMEAAK